MAAIDRLNADDIYNRIKQLGNNGMPIELKNRIQMCEYLGIQPGKTGNSKISYIFSLDIL